MSVVAGAEKLTTNAKPETKPAKAEVPSKETNKKGKG